MTNQIIAQGYIDSNMIITQGYSIGEAVVALKMGLKGILAEKNAWLSLMSERVWTDDFDPDDFEEADFDMGGGGWNAIIEEKEPWKGELKEIEE